MFIELHAPTSGFVTTLRAGFKALSVPLTAPLSDLPGGVDFGGCGGGELWLDRIKVWDGTIVESDGRGVLTVRQPIDALVVSRAALEANGPAPSPPCWIGTVVAVLTLSVEVEAGVPQTCLRFVRLDPGAGVPGPVAAFLGGALGPAGPFGELCEAIDLGVLERMFGGDTPRIRNLGLALSPDGSRLGLHVGLEAAGGAPEQAVYDAAFAEFLGGHFIQDDPARPWSVFMHAALLRTSVRSQVQRSLDGEDRFSLDSGPWTSFKINAAQEPRVEVELSGEAIDACVCLWGEIDVDVDVAIEVSFRLPEPGVIEARLELEIDLDDLEILCCILTAPALWLLIGADLLGSDELEEGEYAAGIVGSILAPWLVSGIAATLVHGAALEQFEMPTDWDKISGDDDDRVVYRSRFHAAFGTGAFGEMTLTELFGVNRWDVKGMVMGGPVAPVPEPGDPAMVLEPPPAAEFGVGFDDACGPDPRLEARYVVAAAMRHGAVLHDARIVEGTDPLNQYAPYLQVRAGAVRLEVVLTIPLDQIQPAYAAAPYAPQLMLITSGGVRILTIPALPLLSADDIAKLQETNALLAPIKCRDWVHAHDFWRGARFNPLWSVDPPPDEMVSRVDYWELAVTGLDPGESVTFETAGGDPLAVVVTGERGGMAWRAVLPPGRDGLSAGLSMFRGTVGPGTELPAPGGMNLRLGDAPGLTFTPSRLREGLADARKALHAGGRAAPERTPRRPARKSDQQIIIRQVQLLEEARIETPGGVRRIAVQQADGPPYLAVAEPGGVSIYELARPGRPMCIRRWRQAGTRGVLAWRGRWIAWGSYGIARVEDEAPGHPARGRAEVVHDVVAAGPALLALTPRGVCAVGDDLALGELVLPAAARLMAAGRSTLALADDRSVTIYERKGPALGRRLGERPSRGLVALTPTPGQGDAFTVRDADGSRTIARPRGGALHTLGRLPRQDPAELQARWKDRLVTAAVGGRRVTVYRQGGVRTLTR